MPDADLVPDVYADQFTMTTSIWGTALSFAKLPPHPTPGQAPQSAPQAVVRMSLQHAKVMTMIMKKQLRSFEMEGGEISIPPAALNAMGLSPEDWV